MARETHVFVRHKVMILSFKIDSYSGTSIQRRARDWAKFVRHNEVSLYRRVLFHIFYQYWGKENRSLHRGLAE